MAQFIDTPQAFRAALPRVAEARVVAVDTEFHTERRFLPELMLLQMRVDEDEPLLVDPDPRRGLPLHELGPLLARVPVLVHGGAADVQLLRRATGARPNVVFDTQVAAACAGEGYPARLQELVWRNLGLLLDKTWTLSDWARRPLTAVQLTYAAEDVLVLGELRARIEARLSERGTTAIAAAATAELLERALDADDDADAWRTVTGAHLLDGAEAAVLQALAAWRQAAARDRDVPRHTVLSDAMLLDLSRRRPASAEALRANRRLSSAIIKRDGDAVLAAVRGAAGGSIAPLHPWSRAWAELVRAAGRVAEARSGVALELLLPDRVLNALHEGRPIEDWRASVLGEEFFAFVEGRGSISLPPGLRRSSAS